jgi:hypothetical protein
MARRVQTIARALQYSATDTSVYELKPPSTPYTVLPPALVGGTKYPYACEILGATSTGTYATGTSCVTPANVAAVAPYENGLEPSDLYLLLTGGTGQTNKTLDLRVSHVGADASHLPPGPYQLTNANSPMTPMPRVQCTASFKCSSSPATPRRPIWSRAGVVRRICIRGSKSRSAPAPTARRRPRPSITNRPARVPPRWAFTMSSVGTCRTSSGSRTISR